MLSSLRKDAKTYLLIAAMPTPNGRLHLGHIGGPFLAVDVLARHLRLLGNKTVFLSGTDSYDSYITGQAAKENKTAEQICNHYHDLIELDLKSMQIEVDRFINPLSQEWQGRYLHWLQLVLQQLQTAGITSTLTETVKIDDETGRFMTGCWLSGLCPHCDAAVCGYFCEDCGAHFRPEEVKGAPDSVNSSQVNNLFMTLPKQSNLDGRGIHSSIKDVYQKFLDSDSGLLRLTANSEWGLSIGNDELGDKFFNYPFAYAYALMMGELAAELAAAPGNALSSASEFVTVAAFGIDNTIPVLGSIDGITAGLPEYKHFDYYLVNHFLYLDGSKFSTSRRHAIWVHDIIQELGASSDIVRLFLATIPTRAAAGNVEVSELHSFYNTTIEWIEHSVVNRFAQLFESVALDATSQSLIDQLESLLSQQIQSLNPQEFRPDLAAAAIAHWLNLSELQSTDSNSSFWWLKGLSVLIYPFMPRLAASIWTALGYDGEPTVIDFENAPVMLPQQHIHTNLARLTLANLEKFSGVKI